jgi:hypothetical protein
MERIMNEPSREQKLESILHAYLQAADAGQKLDREDLLRQHPELAADLNDFFADQEKMDRFAKSMHKGPIGEATIGADGSSETENTLPRIRYFGDYELLEEIARGGMGVVFKARQVSLKRSVALKMILKGELANEADVQRFRDEAEAAANLDHPHIVPIYEIGEHEGQQYFSMKLIGPGKRRADLGVKETVRITALVARAVHHAHQRGILHRDLKPTNILFDEKGDPHVADFGLAKRVSGDGGMTRSGAIVGTPSYMAPEQARAEKVLTTAVDVYSLGAILYEWLAGQPPFRGDDVLATLAMVTNDEPPRPRSLNPDIDRDLETICLKCLSKEPERRYGSAEMLADDLERWLRGEPILARPVSSPERLLKWARRRPERAVLYGMATLALLLGLGWGAWAGWQTIEQGIADRKKLEDERRAAQEARELARNIDIGDHRFRAKFDLATGRERCQQGYVDVGMFVLARGLRRAIAGDADDLERELRIELGRHAPSLPRLVTMRYVGSQSSTTDATYNVSLSRDGTRLVAAGPAWGRRICVVDTPKLAEPPFAEKEPDVRVVAISPDGNLFLSGMNLCDAATGKLLRTIDLDHLIQNARFTPDGKRLLVNYKNQFLFVDPATGKAVGKPFGTVHNRNGWLMPMAISSDGKLIAYTLSQDGKEQLEVAFWDAVTGKSCGPKFPAETVEALAFSPDGKLLATAGHENQQKSTVRLWDTKTGQQVGQPLPQSVRIAFLGSPPVFSPDSKLLFAGGQLWDVETGKPRWPGAQGNPPLAAFHPDGKSLWTYHWLGLSQTRILHIPRFRFIVHNT